jgi:hypothetical protein
LIASLRKGVVSTPVERIAAQHPPDCEPQCFEDIVFAECLQTIVAATWVKTAGGSHKRRKTQLIKSDQPDEQIIGQTDEAMDQ